MVFISNSDIIITQNLSKVFEKNKPCKDKNIAKRFLYYFKPEKEQITALHNFNFNIKEGEFVGLVGQNDAGKTTIYNI